MGAKMQLAVGAGKAAIQSPFIRHCILTSTTAIMTGMSVNAMVFNTNVLFDIPQAGISNDISSAQRTTSDIVTQVENLDDISSGDMPGVNNSDLGGGTSGTADISDQVSPFPSDLSLTEEDVYQKILNCPVPKVAKRAYALACVWKAVAPKYGEDAAIGLMANVVAEGDFGLMQYERCVENWDGNGNTSPVSKAEAPVIVSSKANSKAVMALYDKGRDNHVGFGICQWTWYTYLRGDGVDGHLPIGEGLGDKYLTIDDYKVEELARIEIAFLLDQLEREGAQWITGMNYSDAASSWLANYEKPTPLNDSDRRGWAQNIYDALTS